MQAGEYQVVQQQPVLQVFWNISTGRVIQYPFNIIEGQTRQSVLTDLKASQGLVGDVSAADFKEGGGLHVLPYEEVGIPTRNEGQEQQGIRTVADLIGAAGEEDDGDITLFLDIGDQLIKHEVDDEASAHKKVIHLRIYGQTDGIIHVIEAEFVRVEQTSEALAPHLFALFEIQV